MNLFDSDICWVYITDDGRRRRILFCTDDERDALAHKLMLQSLSASTIDCLIRRYRKLTSDEITSIL